MTCAHVVYIALGAQRDPARTRAPYQNAAAPTRDSHVLDVAVLARDPADPRVEPPPPNNHAEMPAAPIVFVTALMPRSFAATRLFIAQVCPRPWCPTTTATGIAYTFGSENADQN